MRIRVLVLGLVIVIACGAKAISVLAENAILSDDEMVIHQKGPHKLLLPKDWPIITKADGVIMPISPEEYMSLKFGQVRDKFQTTDKRLSALEYELQELKQNNDALQVQMRVLEKQLEYKE